MKISKTEYNTTTNMVTIENYVLTENGKGIISSETVMSCPVAPWADIYEVGSLLTALALTSKRWAFGQ